MFWNVFYDLCTKRETSPNAVCKAIGLSNAMATYWKNGTPPKSDVLVQVADYFNVSTDYLLGRVNKPEPYDKKEDKTIQLSQGHTNGDNSTQEIQDSPVSTYQANFSTDSASQTSQGHTNGNNSTQKIDCSPVNTFQINLPQSDNVTIEFFKAFEELDFFDKVEVMHFALQKVKKVM